MPGPGTPAPEGDEECLGVNEHPSWRGRGLRAAVGLGSVLLTVLAAHLLKKSDGPSYATQPVSRGALTTSVSATGKLAPVNQVTVGSQLSGLVTQVMEIGRASCRERVCQYV